MAKQSAQLKFDYQTEPLRWPPEPGDLLYFQTSTGVQAARLRERRQGLVWMDYVMEDGRIVAEHKLTMCPDPTPWRHPESVTQEEAKTWSGRVRAALDSGVDLREDANLMADMVHYGTYVSLQMQWENGTLETDNRDVPPIKPQ